ncbi:MAG TPA: glycosyltransferase family 2 protein [Patescibacteria group bacterium]|nr:glycosyltransferase family 2 protein [Patescibacteria group bacterium]
MKNLKQRIKKLRKRQWGAEKSTTPLSIFHDKPSTFKLTLSRLSIMFTIVFWLVYIFSIIIRQLLDGPQNYQFTMEAFSYSLVVSFLTFSSLMYLISRHGALERFAAHERTPRAILEKYFSKNQPAITVLVPSYNEENEVIRKTLLSAALQEYPNLRIILLLDDKPYPTNPADAARLIGARNLGKDIKSYLSVPYSRFKKALNCFENNPIKNSVTTGDIKTLASHYKWASAWLNEMAEKEKIDDHVDVFFADQVLKKLAEDLNLVAQALNLSAKEGVKLSRDRIHQLYLRLSWTFKGDVSVFERKKYVSLSHEVNKAMNLNSYIGLMGGTFRKENSPNGIILTPTNKKNVNNLTVPDSEFLLTLDADSILLREYCLRLVYFLKQPENARIAVAQTPYSSFRGAYTRIERLAGATTDIQHILHQGMSYFGATFWVGANAVIRKIALNDIVENELQNGFIVKRFIQDRTVIEDTESSIDLTFHGWQLMNYPERLSYSATPPDFGSLVVQRRRWANGGLLIMPKLFSQIQVRKNRNDEVSRTEFMLRLNYMASIAWATFGLIFLLAYPYDGRLLSPLVLLAAVPYFTAMASDLKYCGYKYSDIFRIYGFNLIMLPVNLAGVLKSIEQAITGKKIPFARTPKVKDRTPASLQFIIVPLLIVGFSIFTVWRNIIIQNWGNAFFAGFNAFAASWAIVAYIGIGNMFKDIWLNLTDWLYIEDKPVKVTQNKVESKVDVDWKAVLYHGEAKGVVPQQSLT